MCRGVVAEDADTAFIGRSFDSEDDCLAVGVWFVEIREVRRWRDGKVVERGYWTGWVGSCGGGRDGCHGSSLFDGREMRRVRVMDGAIFHSYVR